MCLFAIHISFWYYAFCPFSNWIVWFLLWSFGKFLMYFRYQSFVGYMVCRYFLQSITYVFIFLTRSFREWKFLILMKYSLSAFPFMDYAFGVLFSSRSQRSSPLFFLFLFLFASFPKMFIVLWIWVFGPFWDNFSIKCENEVNIYFFNLWMPTRYSSLCWKDYLFSIKLLLHLSKTYWYISVLVYFWVLSSVSKCIICFQIYMSVPLLIPYSLG